MGKPHYFDWAIFNSKLLVISRGLSWHPAASLKLCWAPVESRPPFPSICHHPMLQPAESEPQGVSDLLVLVTQQGNLKGRYYHGNKMQSNIIVIYLLVVCYIAIENDHSNSGFSH